MAGIAYFSNPDRCLQSFSVFSFGPRFVLTRGPLHL